MISRPWIVVVAAFSLSGCSSKDSADSAATTPAAKSTNIAALTSPTAPTGDPTAAEISNYPLDMNKMDRWMAVLRGFAMEAKNDSAMRDVGRIDANVPMASSIQRLESNPRAARVLSSSGMSARDYVMTTAAYLQAVMTASLLKSQPGFKVPAGQSTANIDFLNQHGAELDAKMKQGIKKK